MNMKDILKDAKQQAPNAVVLDLIEEFEAFSYKLEQINKESNDKKEQRQESIKLMSESYDRLRDKLTDAAKFYGMSFEALHALIENSMNFTPGDWAEVQQVKKEVALNLGLFPNKLKKLNKNIKV